MKMKILKILILFSVLFMMSCDKEEKIEIVNQFTVQGTGQSTDHITPNGYLILDDGPSFTNAFMLLFTDGDFIEDTVNGSSLSTDAGVAIVLVVKFGGPNVSSEQAVPVATGTYNLDDNTAVVTNITSFDDTHFVGSVEYGEIDQATFYEIETTGSGTLTIDQINIDYAARTGTVECNYSITADNGDIITGSYTGTFDIINEF